MLSTELIGCSSKRPNSEWFKPIPKGSTVSFPDGSSYQAKENSYLVTESGVRSVFQEKYEKVQIK